MAGEVVVHDECWICGNQLHGLYFDIDVCWNDHSVMPMHRICAQCIQDFVYIDRAELRERFGDEKASKVDTGIRDVTKPAIDFQAVLENLFSL